MKWLVILFFVVGVIYTSYSQNRNELWTRLQISKKMSNIFSIACDIQVRQQANYKANSKNIFEMPSTRSIRFWINYMLKNNYALVLSPISYFNNNDKVF